MDGEVVGAHRRLWRGDDRTLVLTLRLLRGTRS